MDDLLIRSIANSKYARRKKIERNCKTKKRKKSVEFLRLRSKKSSKEILTKKIFDEFGYYEKDYCTISHREFRRYRKICQQEFPENLGKKFNIFFALNDESVSCIRKKDNGGLLLIVFPFESERELQIPAGDNFLAVKRI